MANDSEKRDDRGDRGRWPGFDLGGGGGGEGGGRSRWRYLMVYVLIGIFLLFLFRGAFQPQVTTASLSTFRSDLDANRVAEVTIASDSLQWEVKGGALRHATLP